MAVIENFDAISVQEQMKFAEALLNTINSESIFSDETNFEITEVEASSLTGGLYIGVKQTNPIEVERKATWTAANEDDAESDPDDADYYNDIDEDALKAFKVGSAVIDGYKVEIEIDDVNAEYRPVEVVVDRISYEDSGIGSYEFWGDRGYDSRPYVSVRGTIVESCDCSLSFYVEALDTFEETEAPAETSPDKPEPEVE